METLGFRLKTLRKKKKLTQQQIADAIGVSKTSVIYWEKDDNLPKHESLIALAMILGVDTNYLLYGKSQSSLDNNIDLSQKISLEGRPVPVISWVQAGAWTGIDCVPEGTEFEEWLPPNKDCGPRGYALVVKGLSMFPKFEPEDRIYVNPDIQTFDLQTDDLVIVSCAGDSEATFKKLIIEGGNKYLQPLNPDWPEQIIKLTEDCRLVGKVVGLYRKI